MTIDASPRRVASAAPGRPRSQMRSLLGALVVSTVAVLIGLSGAGVTQAFLTASTTAPGATLTAGTAAIQINGAASAALGSRTLTPNTPAVWAFTVSNTGSVKMDISAGITAPAIPAYAPATRALLVPVANAAACTAAVAGTPASLNGYTATTATLGAIPAAATQTYCLVVSLPAGTSAAGAGSPLTFSLTVDAAQSAS